MYTYLPPFKWIPFQRFLVEIEWYISIYGTCYTRDETEVQGAIPMHKIILFDDDCIFCNKSVSFIMKRDPKRVFKFAALKSKKGQQLLKEYNTPMNMDSLIVLTENTWYEKSAAVIQITKELHGPFHLLYLLKIIPRFLLDPIYTFIANHRYQWFGKQDSCPLPPLEERSRFFL